MQVPVVPSVKDHGQQDKWRGGESNSSQNQQNGRQYEGTVRGCLIFSPDGQLIAYAAKIGQETCAVVDGQEGPKFDDIGEGTLVYLAVKDNHLFRVSQKNKPPAPTLLTTAASSCCPPRRQFGQSADRHFSCLLALWASPRARLKKIFLVHPLCLVFVSACERRVNSMLGISIVRTNA